MRKVILLVALMLPAVAFAGSNTCEIVTRSITQQGEKEAAAAMCKAGREMAVEGRTLRDVQFTVQGLVVGDYVYQTTGKPSKAAELMGVMLIYGFKSQRGLDK